MRHLLLISLLAFPFAASAQGIQTPPSSAATFTSSAPSGSNGFVCRTTGCRVALGGANAYWSSDGSNVKTGGAVVFGNNSFVADTGFRISTGVALVTCNSATEGTVYRLTGTGGTNTLSQTRFCACVSDGAASPTYSWRNLISGTAGNSTTCNP
jgi:hypothetical protein